MADVGLLPVSVFNLLLRFKESVVYGLPLLTGGTKTLSFRLFDFK